jgi:hypothetical protein
VDDGALDRRIVHGSKERRYDEPRDSSERVRDVSTEQSWLQSMDKEAMGNATV